MVHVASLGPRTDAVWLAVMLRRALVAGFFAAIILVSYGADLGGQRRYQPRPSAR